MDKEKANYGCSDYREEMRLLGLKRRLAQGGLTPLEETLLTEEIAALEKKMGLC